MTVFHWVRHGPTHERNFVGWRDVPADLTDQAQIDRLASFLPTDAMVVSSDLRRSVDTATAVTGQRHRLPHVPGLRELHFGHWDGRKFSDISAKYPETSRAYWENPGDIEAPGGESWNMAATRVSAAVDHLARACSGRHIIVVAHFGAILTQVQRALGCSAQEVIGHKIDNFSVTEIDQSKPQPNVIRINHLP